VPSGPLLEADLNINYRSKIDSTIACPTLSFLGPTATYRTNTTYHIDHGGTIQLLVYLQIIDDNTTHFLISTSASNLIPTDILTSLVASAGSENKMGERINLWGVLPP
jgi:hypothetical protein